MDNPRFEFRTEESSKFWEPQLEGNTVTVRFGKIDTTGQTHTKKFSSAEKAKTEYRKLVCDKLAKGYKPTAQTVLALATPVQKPRAIISFFLGQYIHHSVATDFCHWLSACLRYAMTSTQLERTMNKFVEGDEVVAGGFGAEWEESLCTYSSDVDKLPAFYKKAVIGNADRFVSYYDQKEEATHIIAVRGDASTEMIKTCVAEKERSADEKNSTER